MVEPIGAGVTNWRPGMNGVPEPDGVVAMGRVAAGDHEAPLPAVAKCPADTGRPRLLAAPNG